MLLAHCTCCPLVADLSQSPAHRFLMSCSFWCWFSDYRPTCASRFAAAVLRTITYSCHPVGAQASSEELRLSAVRALGALVKGSCIDALLAEENAPLLGHALSLLLQVADSEASAGDKGSRTLRAEAFGALELLMRQVRTLFRRLPARVVCIGAADRYATATSTGWRARCACFFLARHLQWPLHCDTQKQRRCSRGALDAACLCSAGSSHRLSPTAALTGNRADKVRTTRYHHCSSAR
jgi:hypothetical protein